jgi:hypothetical protein
LPAVWGKADEAQSATPPECNNAAASTAVTVSMAMNIVEGKDMLESWPVDAISDPAAAWPGNQDH